MSKNNPKPIEYFINERGCHICTSHYCSDGRYPHKCVFTNYGWKNVKVVKYLWEQVNGPVPEGLCLLHNCDNPKCINLEHVRLGTQLDNNLDTCKRGHDHPKLTEDQVRFIRANRRPYGQKLNNVEFARMFSVCRESISRIVNGKVWSFLK